MRGQETGERLERFGPNTLREVRGKPLWVKLLANFTHLMAILLWIAGMVAFIAQMPQLAISIWTVNLINGAFSFWQEYKAEKATEALRRLLPVYARVLRDGEEQRIPAEELVPGDVMLLSEGDRISADARLVEEAELRVDQSTLTGESHPVRKTSEADHGTEASPASKCPTWSSRAPVSSPAPARRSSSPPAWRPSSARSPTSPRASAMSPALCRRRCSA